MRCRKNLNIINKYLDLRLFNLHRLQQSFSLCQLCGSCLLIPIRLAEVIAFLGYYVCPLSVIFIFIALSVIRVLVYQKCAWFTSVDKMNVVKAVLVIAMFIVVAIRIAETFVKFKKPSYVGYIFYISSVSLKNNQKSEYPSAILIFHLTITLVSFLLELYISVGLKKLSFFSLKSATLGHVFMAAGV